MCTHGDQRKMSVSSSIALGPIASGQGLSLSKKFPVSARLNTSSQDLPLSAHSAVVTACTAISDFLFFVWVAEDKLKFFFMLEQQALLPDEPSHQIEMKFSNYRNTTLNTK